jgi:hypothetical protein
LHHEGKALKVGVCSVANLRCKLERPPCGTDLPAAALENIQPAAFMVIETSPGNFQAWLAVEGAGKAEARRLRKGAGADETASGATRVAGSLNHKRKYAPGFPVVTMTHAQAGRVQEEHRGSATGRNPCRPAKNVRA